MNEQFLAALQAENLPVSLDESLGRHTTFRIGGNADFLCARHGNAADPYSGTVPPISSPHLSAGQRFQHAVFGCRVRRGGYLPDGVKLPLFHAGPAGWQHQGAGPGWHDAFRSLQHRPEGKPGRAGICLRYSRHGGRGCVYERGRLRRRNKGRADSCYVLGRKPASANPACAGTAAGLSHQHF